MHNIKWLLVVIGGFLLAYAILIEPNWIQVSNYAIASKGTSSVRVVQISDLHFKGIGNRERQIINKLFSLRPDLIIFSGDVIDNTEHLDELEIYLSMMPDCKKFAVFGNWEYWSGIDRERLSNIYKKLQVRLLINERSNIQVRQNGIAIIGLDDFTAGDPNPEGLLINDANNFQILVEHSPGYFGKDQKTANLNLMKNALCLSGHTHGGQISLFGYPIWTPPGSGKFISGWYKVNECRLYVSRGLGTSILPIRFWSRPEIAVFDIGKI